MKRSDPDYIKGCKACEEAITCGLTFEETHSTRKIGYLDTEDGFILSPHFKEFKIGGEKC